MVLVLSIIFGGGFIVATLNLLNPVLTTTLAQNLLITGSAILALFLVDLIVAMVLYWAMPRKWFNPFSKLFKVYPHEKAIYVKLGVRVWKDKVPNQLGMKKDKVHNPEDTKYILDFLHESCVAEAMHFISLFLGFVILPLYPTELMLAIALPCCFINALLQWMPVVIQRYNRPRLLTLYKKNTRQT